MSQLLSDPSERQTFPHRVVRGVAWVCLGSSILGLVSFGANLLRIGIYPPSFFYKAYLASACMNFVQLFGAIQLLRWKRSGRVLLRIWAILGMALGLLWSVSYLIHYLVTLPPTTQPSSQEDRGFMVVYLLADWLEDAALPVLVWLILSRSEVGSLWANAPASGFEVVPMGQPIEQRK